ALVSSIDEIRLADKSASTKFRSHMKTARKITTAVAKRGVIGVAKAATLGALDLEKEVEAIAADVAGAVSGDVVDMFQKEKEALRKFRGELEKAVDQLKAAGKKDKLIFFIDELDRCRPTFAIEMLERIKHLFDVPNIIFVLSVDKGQLEASTAAIYGQQIDAREYLRRFIDLEYGIPVAQTKRFTQVLLTRFELDEVFAGRTGELQYEKRNFVDFFTMLADAVGLSLRARERCVTQLCVVMDQTPPNHYLEPILVALLVVLRSKKPSLFFDLCNGAAGAETAMEYLRSLPGGAKLVADRSGVVIESYLIAGDPDRDRRDVKYKTLQEQAKSEDASPGTLRARELVEMRQHVFSGFRDPMSLVHVAKKIDLAASVRD
ncbi:MAG TPA: P-loop NTPase fold protein, partial [Rhodoferax sp.]